ncbi:MAG: HNH endonuclease [Kiritimatiellae bacterium]|nr:HNH endonuclease [Kiritimatiellia bacterium]
MNITLRPSGGRGEYELAGRQGDLHVHDLFGLPLFIEILPGMEINAYSTCVLKDGKPRIRLTRQARNAHPSALIAAAMMLPKPRRERHETRGTNVLSWEQFVVQTVRIDAVKRGGGVLICPVTIRIENADDVRLDISFAERMARVLRVWTAASPDRDEIASAVRAHATAFSSPTATQDQLIGAFAALHSTLKKPDTDMLPLLEAHYKLGRMNAPSTGDISAEVTDETFAEEVHVNPTEARIERVRQWRLAAVRGASANTFRSTVRDAYDSRCLFTGQRLPRTEATTTAGVDVAHILPWSRFDLDAATNGLCLSKQCHWAFDEGVFRLSFDDKVNAYVVAIPNPVHHAAHKAKFDMAAFDAITGPIPENRLPKNSALWPSKVFLTELNQFLDGKVS